MKLYEAPAFVPSRIAPPSLAASIRIGAVAVPCSPLMFHPDVGKYVPLLRTSVFPAVSPLVLLLRSSPGFA
jgi:hypothetical protein